MMWEGTWRKQKHFCIGRLRSRPTTRLRWQVSCALDMHGSFEGAWASFVSVYGSFEGIYIGLFCGYVGLFCGYVGLFCEYPRLTARLRWQVSCVLVINGCFVRERIGLFCGCVGLFCGCAGLFCGYIGLFCERIGLFNWNIEWLRSVPTMRLHSRAGFGYMGLFWRYIYRALLWVRRALVWVRRALLWIQRALFWVRRALVWVRRSLLCMCRSLLCICRALLRFYFWRLHWRVRCILDM